MTIFQTNLIAARKKTGLTQKQAALILREKIKTYQAWEEGRSEPGLKKLTIICDLFKIDDLYLFVSEHYKF